MTDFLHYATRAIAAILVVPILAFTFEAGVYYITGFPRRASDAALAALTFAVVQIILIALA